MPTPNQDYRENPRRAIYITGKIDQALVDRVSPLINEFRFQSAEPITVYIDSPGGSINLAETIRHHLKAPNPDGKRCRLITVVTSRAASAAADFLALGDYSIAYPYADVMYHGSRTPSDSSLTTEMAAMMARSLQQSNEICAVRLARHAFPRFILRLTQLHKEMVDYVNGKHVSTLVTALRKNLSSSNGILLRDAMRKQRVILDLTASAFGHILKFKNNGGDLSPAEFEGEMFRAIVKYKIRLHKKNKNDFWRLSTSGIQEVTEDFNLLHDFHFGSQRRDLAKWDQTYGHIFLSDTEKTEHAALTGTTEEKAQWLVDKSEPKLRPLWYLMISLSRLLQGDDYSLTAEEAYWLGLVDEIPGSSLPCVRIAEENLPPLAKP